MLGLPADVIGALEAMDFHQKCTNLIWQMGEAIRACQDADVHRFYSGYGGMPGTVVYTSTHLASQEALIEGFQGQLPGVGLQAEELGVVIEPTLVTSGGKVVLTADPLDGTSWYCWLLDHPDVVREGVYVMLGLRVGLQAAGAYLLDVYGEVLYSLAPGASRVVRSGEGGISRTVTIPLLNSTGGGTLLLPQGIGGYPGLQALLHRLGPGQAPQLETTNKGLAHTFVRLVEGRAVAMARRPGRMCTPWDDLPLTALGKALGVKVFSVRNDGKLARFTVVPPTTPWKRSHGLLYVAPAHAPVFERLCQG